MRERARARAGEGRLLLDDGQREHVARARRRPRPRAGRPRRRRSSRRGCRARATRADRSGSSTGSASITATSPIRTQLARLVAVLGADVDVEVLELGGTFLRSSSLSRWIGLRADHARDRAVARRDPDALADEHDRIPAADLAEAQVAVVVDVRDVQADLVDVADDRQRRAAGGARDARASRSRRGRRRPRRRTHEQPSRQTCAGPVSWPDGPAAVSSCCSSSGIAMARKAIGRGGPRHALPRLVSSSRSTNCRIPPWR